MKVYAHGPRANLTFQLRNIQFIDGVATVTALTPYMKSFGIRDYPPEGFIEKVEVMDDTLEVESKPDLSADEIIKQALEARLNKKPVIEEKPEPITSLKGIGKGWLQVKKIIKEKTGVSPKNKEEALYLLNKAQGTLDGV